jgi:hypothetical protein
MERIRVRIYGCVAALVAALPVAAADHTREIVREGDLFGGPATAFSSFIAPSINNAGAVVFNARLGGADTNAGNNSGVFRLHLSAPLLPVAGGIAAVLREGTAVPDRARRTHPGRPVPGPRAPRRTGLRPGRACHRQVRRGGGAGADQRRVGRGRFRHRDRGTQRAGLLAGRRRGRGRAERQRQFSRPVRVQPVRHRRQWRGRLLLPR